LNRQRITILGSTGSIGDSTLNVVAVNPELFEIYALTAKSNWQKLFSQVQQFSPDIAVCVDQDAATQLQKKIKAANLKTEVLQGFDALDKVASDSEVDTVMAAIVGAAGLKPSLAAATAGKRILLANKEALVMAGDIFMQQVKNNNALLLPVDSEHNALFQCLPNHLYQPGKSINWSECGVEKLVLTASGGPFLDRNLDQLNDVTPAQACAHPNWEMGKKISVDSATLMNKGLEVIEASYLFGIAANNIEVVVHPQSIVHSLVSYQDGSVLAELGNPDMRTPIAHVLGWPSRVNSGVKPLDLVEIAQLDFKAVDLNRFKCLKMAYQALNKGGTSSAILNAANEVAVDSFLKGLIKFNAISEIIEEVLNKLESQSAATIDVVIEADQNARSHTSGLISSGAFK
jgi:1-deoxy-D-xylulose-5-phosphate reductoisomerase